MSRSRRGEKEAVGTHGRPQRRHAHASHPIIPRRGAAHHRPWPGVGSCTRNSTWMELKVVPSLSCMPGKKLAWAFVLMRPDV